MEDRHGGDAPRRSWWRRLAIALAAIGTIAGIAVSVQAIVDSSSENSAEDPFYEAPDPLPAGAPGTIIRSEPISRPPLGTKAYRILYVSRGHRDHAVALSALLFVPQRPAPSTRRSIVAVAHGTVGVARNCGVSTGRGFFDNVAGLRRFIRSGYAVVVPDGEGLGTAGTHPYLVGGATARATLDAVRATRRFPAADASARFAVWGVGQGGHAALFAGQVARAYAPELELAGVAAAAPMANLGRLVEATAGTPPGDVMAAYMLHTWSVVYPQLDVADVVAGRSRATIEQLAALCVPIDHERIGPALEGHETKLAYRRAKPWTERPWRDLLARNAPGASAIAAPVIITQGREDSFVRPSATARFVRYLCAQGATVLYRPSRGVAHYDVGEKTAPYVSNWIGGRFAGETAGSTC